MDLIVQLLVSGYVVVLVILVVVGGSKLEKGYKALQIDKKLEELDQKLWARGRILAGDCTPYNMDEEYQTMLKQFAELEKKAEELK